MAVEPRAFALIAHLVENADRLVGKDELADRIWEGRIVTDAAISTLVKSARKALGDSGALQKYIRTLHGRGFRFVAEARLGNALPARAAEALPGPGAAGDAPAETGRQPSLAVLPFALVGAPERYGAIADAVPGELIASLSRLRWLKVIARGSSFRFRGSSQSAEEIGAILGATYLLTGTVELIGDRLAIAVELADCRSGQAIWAERRSGDIGDVHLMRDEIAALVVSATELHVPLQEAELARLKSPESLDAWGCYHLGIQHMYRFNRADNARAAAHFARATALDPHFARAHAALSFTSFQSAFLRYGGDRQADVEDARRHAERAVELDPMDPFGNFTYGRAHWLRGDPEAGQAWLERAMSLSPSFAQGHYAHGWASVMAGQGEQALGAVRKAVDLSPLDPFLYAMESARGIAHLHIGNLDRAAHWSAQGARKPGAHHLISAIAAAICDIAGKPEEAAYWKLRTFERRPDTTAEQFFTAFPFRDPAIRGELERSLDRLGFRAR
nr:winged helix-turn-helix domain-containing protein [Mangrovicoccus sp. HB161399]